MKNQQGLQGAQWLGLCQLGMTVLLSILALIFLGATAAVSGLLGGIVSMVPHAVFARTVFQHQEARSAKKIVNRFYKGEAMKWAITVILFALVFQYVTLFPMVFFLVYIAAQMVFWFAPMVFKATHDSGVPVAPTQTK